MLRRPADRWKMSFPRGGPYVSRAALLLTITFVVAIAILVWRDMTAGPHGAGLAPEITSIIEVIDGDTVKVDGQRYRLVGFDTPERGSQARCDDERRRADLASKRLQALVAGGKVHLQRVPCACKPGTEGTRFCNYGRFCGVLTVAGRDVGPILIGEGLAQTFICGGSSCPPRRSWCGQ